MRIFTRLFLSLVVLASASAGYGQAHWCNFAFLDSSGCVPYVMKAVASDAHGSPVVQRQWTLTQGGSGCLPGGAFVGGTPPGINDTFQYIFNNPGCYCLTLRDSDQAGQTCTITKCDIKIDTNPTLNFSFIPSILQNCPPLTLGAICHSTPGSGTITRVVILWGDGSPVYIGDSCTLTPITHTYNAIGTDSVTITVINNFGCFADSTYRGLVTVLPPPVACFTADTTYANCTSSPLIVHFTPCTLHPGLIYCWYVDNFPKQCGPNPNFTDTFSQNPSCYDIKLVERYASGCADSITKPSYICVRQTPVISFTQTATTVCVNGQHSAGVCFTNTTPGADSIFWNLSGFPQKYGSSACYIISTPGTYTLHDSAVFGVGCTATLTQPVLVANLRPTAAFTQTDTFSCKIPVIDTISTPPCVGCTYNWYTPFLSSQHTSTIYVTYNSFSGLRQCVELVETAADGCADTLQDCNILILNIVPTISSSRLQGCAPLCPTFTNATSLVGYPVTYVSQCWSFPGSAIPGACQNSYTPCFSTPGCYNVKLVSTTNTGCVNSVEWFDTICVGTAPVCTMTASPDTMCFEQDSVQFTVNCDSFTFITVDFGDGTPMETFFSSTFSHYYQETGTICTQAIAYQDSCPGNIMSACVVIEPPITKFSDSTTCLTGDTVFLLNQSIGATSSVWHFCNGDSSHLVEPSIVLPPCGTCAITLQTYDSISGCHHQKTTVINTACTSSASFTPMIDAICSGTTLTLTNTSVSNTPGYTVFQLDTVANGDNFSGPGAVSGNSISPILSPGVHTICMRNKTSVGCIDIACGTVSVCRIIPKFGYASGCFPAPICFQDSTISNGCIGLSWIWTFGDGGTDTVQNPCHSYNAPGAYRVTEVVQTPAGCRQTYVDTVIVSDSVTINYSMDTFLCPGSQECVTNNSSGLALVYNWSMPGATPSSSTSAAPCFTYSTPGNYFVNLSLSSNNQCRVVASTMVQVHFPVAAGNVSQTYLICPSPPTVIYFTDSSQYADTSFYWDFGNGTFSNNQNIQYEYSKPGFYTIRHGACDKQGCCDTSIIDTLLVAGPIGSLTVMPTPGVCACRDSVHFSVSTIDATSYFMLDGCNQCQFSDPNIIPIGTSLNPTIFNDSCFYCSPEQCPPQMILKDPSGCAVAYDGPIVYIDSPVIKFTFNSFGVCQSGQVCFFDSTTYFFPDSISNTVSRLWDFGDGTTDVVQNPCHFFALPGVYHVHLYIHSNFNCFDSLEKTVIIPTRPVAGYFTDDSVICTATSTCFHDSSQFFPFTGAAYWTWNFGDNTPTDTIYIDSICHTFVDSGSYRVTMCVYDSFGCSNCDSGTIIQVLPSPQANAGGNQTVCYGQSIQLNGSGGVSYSWSPTALFSNPNIQDPTVQPVQDTTVTVVVGNILGCSDSATARITVPRVIANFNSSPTACLNDSFCVTDASTFVDQPINSWSYNFGDGTIINGKDVCHLYSAPGTYSVALIVGDAQGCLDTFVEQITINPNPEAAFSLNDTVICSNDQICMTDLSTDSPSTINSWLWNYGDNTGSSVVPPPCHTYSPPFLRHYTVSLIVTDQNHCTDTASIVITVNKLPDAEFTWTPTCGNNPTPFTSTSLPADTTLGTCQWTFWLGATNPQIDNTCNASFLFAPGTYNVQLVVTDLNGCRDTIVEPVTIDSLSQLSINPGDTTICLGMSVDYHVTGVFSSITWMPDIWLSNTDSPVVTINPLSNVDYRVCATNGVCPAVCDTIAIHVVQPIPVSATATPPQIVLGMSSTLAAIIPPNIPIDSIVWTPDTSLNCSNCPSPTATPGQTTSYIATIYYGTDGIICSNNAQATVVVLNSCDQSVIYLPNTFTPNGDGLNDVFLIRGIATVKIDYFRVFDRWGRLVFETTTGATNDPRWGWDGTDPAGKKLNNAVYVYTYQIECVNGNIVTGQGNVTLVR